jgi:hypothetical protein
MTAWNRFAKLLGTTLCPLVAGVNNCQVCFCQEPCFLSPLPP